MIKVPGYPPRQAQPAAGQGRPGRDGVSWSTGQGAPTTDANDGDLYLDVATGDVYREEDD